jgi:SAM-dependent methyltransferase
VRVAAPDGATSPAPPKAARAAEEVAFLAANARVSRALGLPDIAHLDQPIGILSYVRIADDIARRVPRGDLLDWGCGWGQMTYLLRRRGFRVTAFDVGDPAAARPDVPLCRAVQVVRSPDPTALPFADGAFDDVLSCGVLEHVAEDVPGGDERGSLREVRRVLRPGGRLLIYQLPQQYSWQEAAVRRLGLGSGHRRRFTAAGIDALLRQEGFVVESLRRTNLVPRNLTGMPERLRVAYSRLAPCLIAADEVLSRAPGLEHVAGALEVVARRT